MDFHHDYSSQIRVNEVFGNFKRFTENIKLSVTPYEPDEGNISIRNIVDHGQLCVRSKGDGPEIFGCDDFKRRLSLEAAVTVMPVMKPLEVLALPFEHCIA